METNNPSSGYKVMVSTVRVLCINNRLYLFDIDTVHNFV